MLRRDHNLAVGAWTMRTHREEQFVEWAKNHGLALEPGYPQTATLTFDPDPGLSRFWPIPPDPFARSYFLSVMLDLMGRWHSCFAWRHMGSWPAAPETINPNEMVQHRMLSGLGLPMGTADIVQFERSEDDKLLSLLLVTTIFAWSTGQDLYVVPDHARYILKAYHHDVVYAHFRTKTDLNRFVKGMEKDGFCLPTDVPDGTFARPDWMKSE